MPEKSKAYRILSNRYFLLFLGVIILLGGIILTRPGGHERPDKATVVETTTVQVKPMPIEVNMPGIVDPLQTVAVKSQVTGILKKIYFNPGAEVEKNQLLFEIEPAPFIAQLRKAQANLAQNQAQLEIIQKDVERYAKLYKQNYVSQQQYNQIQANYASQKALVDSNKQEIEQAKINLGYTKIYSAIHGKAGNIAFKIGDLISAETNTLVTINQIDPIQVDFNLPQKYLKRVRRYFAQGTTSVEIWRESQTKLLSKGQLDFIDNQVNNQTGTVLLKAKINNAEHQLWPGQMVSVKLILTIEPNAIVIPTRAVQSDQEGNFVFLAQDGKAVLKRIEIDRQIGDLSVIKSGLSAGEMIISVVPPELDDGDQVQLTAANNQS